MDDRALLGTIRRVTGDETCSDDCAVLHLGDYSLVTSTDMLHEKTDFPGGMTDWQIGWMSVAVTISDIAAMGAEPVQVFLAIGLDREERLEQIVRGADACCRTYRAVYAGGDLDAHGELTIVSTGIGIVRDGSPVRRRGAEPGDLIGVTGILGRAILGLEGDRRFWNNLCEPQPRIQEGIAARKAGVTAMMDISDGLALSLYDIGDISGIGMEIISSRIPVPEDAERSRALDAALYGGGDFELLFFIPEDHQGSLPFPFTI
ncbi:MAG: thiamine-phosphate kinase, partial [Methanospirillum sp.]|nr:thiamine-phosphate kinase [Methanospirillum sp.]